MTRGLLTVEAVKARCIVDKATHCWDWQGAMGSEGTPRIYTFDHERGEKRPMSGPKAMWNIAHQEAPPRYAPLVYRCCGNRACLNPAHLRNAGGRAEIGESIARSRRWKGKSTPAQRTGYMLGLTAQGITPTAPDVVRAIKAESTLVAGRAIAAKYEVSESIVSRIRRGKSHKGIL